MKRKRRTLVDFKSLNAEQKHLIERAMKASKKAHCPYSGFKVGAAVLAQNKSGRKRIFPGCNIEICNYGCTLCAERVACAKAISDGYTKVISIAIYAPNAPKRANSCGCGMCRQFLAEFGLDIVVLKMRNDGKAIVKTLKQLIPNAFVPKIVQVATAKKKTTKR